jgi:tryptophanyl-tRNA synthetase
MRVLSGIQPSGKLHLGNYFGAIAQFLELQASGAECLIFIADLHALTTVRDGEKLRALSHDVALDYLALGLDPEKVTLFRQSDVPEVTELFWVLMTVTPMGVLERAHAYKDKVAKGISADAGLFAYPVLMAADILLYDSDEVPVGRDQQQHLEMARDLAQKFNVAFGEGLLKLPRARIQEASAVVVGTDGQKMSKSYGNTIDLFGDASAAILGIKTDSTSVDAPKDPSATPLYPLLRLLATEAESAEIERTFRQGGLGYGHYKKQLVSLFDRRFDTARERRRVLQKDVAYVESVLAEGAKKARSLGAPVIDRVRRAVGV